MIFETIWPYIFNIFLVLCCTYAVYRGHLPEYIGATIMLAAAFATFIVVRIFGMAWIGFELGIFIVDMAALLGLIHLTITSDRFWPIWATAFQLLAISIHVARVVAPEIAPWALATGAVFWAYPALLVLAIGAHEHIRPAEAERLRTG